jgi:hypothetical protein
MIALNCDFSKKGETQLTARLKIKGLAVFLLDKAENRLYIIWQYNDYNTLLFNMREPFYL